MFLQIYYFRNCSLFKPPRIPIPGVSQGSLLWEIMVWGKSFVIVCLPLPHPIPGVSQSSRPGGKTYRGNSFLLCCMKKEKLY